MASREPGSAARRGKAWFVDRLLYERRPGGGRFVTLTRRAQIAMLTLFLLALGWAGAATGGLVLGYRHHREQIAALGQAGQANAAAVAEHDRALAEANAEIERLRTALATAGDARAALEVERRAVASGLEAARAKEALLTAQLEGAERARAKLAAELEEAKGRIAALEGSAGTAAAGAADQGELARLAAENATLVARGRDLEAELARLKGAAVAQPAPAAAPGEDAMALTQKLQAVEARNAELEAFFAERAPAPPEPAPR